MPEVTETGKQGTFKQPGEGRKFLGVAECSKPIEIKMDCRYHCKTPKR